MIVGIDAALFSSSHVSEMTYYVSSGTLNLTKPKPIRSLHLPCSMVSGHIIPVSSTSSATVSEVTTLRRYRNVCIIIIVVIITSAYFAV